MLAVDERDLVEWLVGEVEGECRPRPQYGVRLCQSRSMPGRENRSRDRMPALERLWFTPPRQPVENAHDSKLSLRPVVCVRLLELGLRAVVATGLPISSAERDS